MDFLLEIDAEGSFMSMFHSGSSWDICKTIILTDTAACRKEFHITREKRFNIFRDLFIMKKDFL